MKTRTNKARILYVCQAGITAALYTVLTYFIGAFDLASGAIQVRLSDALCVLPVFFPAAIPGLFVGCFLSNLFCGAAGLDIVFGSLATLIGAVGSYALRKSKVLVCVPPILANTIIVPWVLRFQYGSEDLIPFMMLTVGIGEVLAIGVLGSILLAALNRYKTMLFGKCLATGR